MWHFSGTIKYWYLGHYSLVSYFYSRFEVHILGIINPSRPQPLNFTSYFTYFYILYMLTLFALNGDFPAPDIRLTAIHYNPLDCYQFPDRWRFQLSQQSRPLVAIELHLPLDGLKFFFLTIHFVSDLENKAKYLPTSRLPRTSGCNPLVFMWCPCCCFQRNRKLGPKVRPWGNSDRWRSCRAIGVGKFFGSGKIKNF